MRYKFYLAVALFLISFPSFCCANDFDFQAISNAKSNPEVSVNYDEKYIKAGKSSVKCELTVTDLDLRNEGVETHLPGKENYWKDTNIIEFWLYFESDTKDGGTIVVQPIWTEKHNEILYKVKEGWNKITWERKNYGKKLLTLRIKTLFEYYEKGESVIFCVSDFHRYTEHLHVDSIEEKGIIKILEEYSDGAQDITNILQTAIANGAVIDMPPGKYKVEGTVNMKSGSGIVGAEDGETVIVLSSKKSGFLGIDCRNVSFSHLKIVDDDKTDRLRQCYAIRFITSLNGKSENITLHNIYVDDISGGFFSATGACINVNLSHITVTYDNKKKFIRSKIPVAADYYITAIDFEWNTTEVSPNFIFSSGVWHPPNGMPREYPTPRNVVLENIVVYGGDNGIWVGGVRDLKMHNISLINQKNQAILLSSGDWSDGGVMDVRGEDIYIKGNGKTMYGLKLAGYSVQKKAVIGVRRCSFQNVTVQDCQKPILLQDGACDNQFRDLRIIGSESYPIQIRRDNTNKPSGCCNNNHFENVAVVNPKGKVCVVIKNSHYNIIKGLKIINANPTKIGLLGGDGGEGNVLIDPVIFQE